MANVLLAWLLLSSCKPTQLQDWKGRALPDLDCLFASLYFLDACWSHQVVEVLKALVLLPQESLCRSRQVQLAFSCKADSGLVDDGEASDIPFGEASLHCPARTWRVSKEEVAAGSSRTRQPLTAANHAAGYWGICHLMFTQPLCKTVGLSQTMFCATEARRNRAFLLQIRLSS